MSSRRVGPPEEQQASARCCVLESEVVNRLISVATSPLATKGLSLFKDLPHTQGRNPENAKFDTCG